MSRYLNEDEAASVLDNARDRLKDHLTEDERQAIGVAINALQQAFYGEDD